MHTIIVVGAAYAGYRAAEVLAQGVPDDWRIIVIDKNTHFNRESPPPRAPRIQLPSNPP